MLKSAQFYVFNAESSHSIESFASELAAKAWREGKRVLIACETQAQAFLLDELLWQRSPDEFVPHNLSGEITQYPTPIEISWKEKRNAQRRDLLINLQQNLPEFTNIFTQFFDFVPHNEEQKILARERYKQLRSNGWQLSTENV